MGGAVRCRVGSCRPSDHPLRPPHTQSTVNANFTSDVFRPVDLHVDLLNAQTKVGLYAYCG